MTDRLTLSHDRGQGVQYLSLKSMILLSTNNQRVYDTQLYINHVIILGTAVCGHPNIPSCAPSLVHLVCRTGQLPNCHSLS